MNADYKMNLDQFAAELSRLLDRPVIDKAGIAGTFDLHFEFVVDEPTSALMPGLRMGSRRARGRCRSRSVDFYCSPGTVGVESTASKRA
jgi:uncharacterized protein (TIGR03435 family)